MAPGNTQGKCLPVKETTDAESAREDRIRYIGTTIPAESTTPPELQCECITTAHTKRKLYAIPGFPRPIPIPPTHSPSFRIGPAPGCGDGMFATRAIRSGEYICRERPLLACPVAMPVLSEGVDETTTSAEFYDVSLLERQVVMKAAFDRLDPERKRMFASLANSHTQDGSGPILGRIRTNGIAVIGLFEVLGTEEVPYSCVPYHISKVNHSCRPNAEYGFHLASFSAHIRALRNIEEGEQIFISYIDNYAPTVKRQKLLEPYGFRCACASCTNDNPDAARPEVKPPHLPDVHVDSDGSVLESCRAESMAQLDIIDREGMWDLPEYWQHLGALARLNRMLGDTEKMEFYLSMLPEPGVFNEEEDETLDADVSSRSV